MVKFNLDDITAVTALLCDTDIRCEDTFADDDDDSPAHKLHCRWVLESDVYEQEEVTKLVDWMRQAGGKRDAKDRPFSFRCTNCGLGWMDSGPCSAGCWARMAGIMPDMYKFDAVKKFVIYSKRKAQSEAAEERGEPNPFG